MEIVEYGLLKASGIAAFIISPPNDIRDFQNFCHFVDVLAMGCPE